MIRKAEVQDISRIAEIIVFGKRVAYRAIFQNDVVSFCELQVIHSVEEYRRNPLLLENMLVYDDGILKGVINRKLQEDEIEVSEFYVEPFFKRKGIGGRLLQTVIAETRAANKRRIFLWVVEDNLSARKFYEKNGFRENGETRLIEGTSKTDICYELMLDEV